MSGRDFGRGGRGNFGDRDRDRGRGGSEGGGFRDRDRSPGGFRDRFERPPERGGGSRPWERRDEAPPARPSGDRPFDRPERPEQDVRVERYYEEPARPRRDERDDRPPRVGGDRERNADGPPRGDRERGRERDFGGPPRADRLAPTRRESPPVGQQTPAPVPGAGEASPPATPGQHPAASPVGASALALGQPAVGMFRGQDWTSHHLSESWRDEERLRGWTPSDQDLQEMVEDNIEADPQINGRNRRNIQVQARGGVVTLTGAVRSRQAKFAAGSDAYWTYGVQTVHNELTVRTRGPEAKGAAQGTTSATTATAPQSGPTSGAGGTTATRASQPDPSLAALAPAPPASGGDSADSGEPNFMPPRTSPTPDAPDTGSIDPLNESGELMVVASKAADDEESDEHEPHA